jgi:hypothetical protein
MVNATSNVQSNPFSSILTPEKPAGATLNSFAQQLSTALEGYFGQLQSGANLRIDIQGAQSQDSGDRQFTVTVTDPNTASTPMTLTEALSPHLTTASTLSTTASTTASTSTPKVAAPQIAATASDPATTTTVDKSKMSPTDAYWAEQPEAVQALRDCPQNQRYAMAQELYTQGYTIDMPIMVWGWDPLMTMTLRQNEGYTWVPSAFQPNIPIGPGIANVWNVPSYDPNNPPPGSIKVSTDFAQGTNMALDPWSKTLNA